MSIQSAAQPAANGAGPFSVEQVRADFPILTRRINGHPLIYADNAATTQKPAVVIERIRRFYAEQNANVHRGVHTLSAEATAAYEAARESVRAFLNAAEDRELVFTRGTTEAVNLVAQSYGRATLEPGDEVLISGMEHHSNIVPWQMVCEQTGAALRVVPISDDGEIELGEFDRLLSERTRIVAVVHVSNALGTVNPVGEITRRAHAAGAVVLVDGAQATIHEPVDVQAIGCDFYALSGHKALAPTGIGVLYGRAELLEAMPPYQGGGDMIKVVRFDRTEYNEIPFKFEAGTPNVSGSLGLAAALDYFRGLDLEGVVAHERALLEAATSRADAIPGLRVIGRARHKAAVMSFTVDGVHPNDIGTLLDTQGVAVRTGHHCAMPLMERFGVSGTARASFALYNTLEEVHAVFDALEKILPMLKD